MSGRILLALHMAATIVGAVIADLIDFASGRGAR